MVGRVISHYEIVEKLGEGGMGEVYKARDTQLDRFVAIKILPPGKIANPGRKRRFIQEAKAASALNHPNIIHIYDIGQQDGTDYIVMEFVPGTTLDQIIPPKGLRLNDALKYGVQVADALTRAHAARIVHRDLKPGNIIVGEGGLVKLLDFGLAKLTEPGVPSEDETTLTLKTTEAPLTEDGAIVGTVSYMSPEQAEGKPVDARSDIFSFGALLYEMVTGRRAFHGDSKTSTLAAILNKDPKPAREVNATVPGELEKIIARCLRKDPERRIQHMDDVKLALLETLGEERREETPAPPVPQPEVRGVRRERIAFIAALVIAAGVIAALWLTRPTAVPEGPVRKFHFTPEVAVYDPVVSPNGRYIVYVASDDEQRSLSVQDLTGLQPRQLQGTERAELPFCSPDSEYVLFAARGKLWRIPVEGGTPATICDVPTGQFTGGVWSPDGNSIVFSVNQLGIYEVPARGGTPNLIIKVDPKLGDHFDTPVFLPAPNGKRILLYAARVTGSNHEVVVQDLETGAREVLASNVPGQVTYSPTGHVIYFQNGSLWALPFSPAAMKPVGEAFPIVNGGYWPSVALDGTLVYLEPDWRWQLVWRNRGGKKTGTIGQFQLGIPALSLSPDGHMATVESWKEDFSTIDLWVYDIPRNIRSPLAKEPALDRTPIWHPDGKTVTFSSYRQGNWDIFSKPVDGSREAKPLVATPRFEQPDDWSPDGRFLVYNVVDPKSGSGLWYLKQSESGDRFEAPQSLKAHGKEARFSPDGRFLAYVSNESGKEEVYVQPFPEGGGREPISRNGGTQPQWRKDGKELFYVEGDTLMAVPVTLSPQFSAGVARALFKDGSLHRETNVAQQKYAASSDGQQFLLPERFQDTHPPVIRVVQNWFAEFRDRPRSKR